MYFHKLTHPHTCPSSCMFSHSCTCMLTPAHPHSAPATGKLWTDYLAPLTEQSKFRGTEVRDPPVMLRVSLSRRRVEANVGPTPSSDTNSGTSTDHLLP